MKASQCTYGILLGAAVAVAALITPSLRAQTTGAVQRAPAAVADPSAALLAEVRALRSELADATRTGLQAQLLVARVQLQEQRVIYLDRRRAEVSAQAADATERSRRAQDDLNQFQHQIDIAQSDPKIDAEKRTAIMREIRTRLSELNRHVQAAQADEQRLRAEETELVNALATEQGRWSDFNARLDELERALPQP